METRVADALKQLTAFLLPVVCAGCGIEGETVCPVCRGALVPRPLTRTVRVADGSLVVHSALEWDETTAALLAALKQQGRTGVARALAPAMRAAVMAARPRAARVAVVAVPSSPRALRERGYAVVDLLLRRAGVPVVPLLAVRRQAADQRRLGREERRRNMSGVFTVRARLPAACTGVILVDDVITTGATMHDASAAIRAAGIPVLGAATVVSTMLRNLSGNHA